MVEITIDVIDRGIFKADTNYMIEASSMADINSPNQETHLIDNQVYNFVIDHPEGTFLWDTGCHPECADGHWPDDLYDAFALQDPQEHTLEADLDEEGWDIDDIDAVFMSHLHVDHTGGLHHFHGTDVPIYVHAEELKWAYASANADGFGGGYLTDDFDADLNWEVMHGDRREYFEDIEFIHNPGHTPGLTSTLIHLDDGHTVFIVADEAYHATNYHDEVPLGAGLLWNGDKWYQNLQFCKDIERRHDAELVFGHDPDQMDRIGAGWP